MKTYISLLRGINVSGQKKIIMEELRTLYESLGLNKVQSYIQSGNVLFQSDKKANALTKTIEQGIEKQYGYHVTVIIKTPDDLKKAIQQSPFQNIDETKLHVAFLARKPSKPDMSPIEAVAVDGEQVKLVDDRVYLYCPNGSGRSKLSNNLIEKKLDTPATMRNWRTTNKLISLADEL